ncbi:MAG TPA: hypothetical protein VIF10_12165 [Methylobacter sp.]|jgi:hypothetical protein
MITEATKQLLRKPIKIVYVKSRLPGYCDYLEGVYKKNYRNNSEDEYGIDLPEADNWVWP